jgi:hypothetical protein
MAAHPFESSARQPSGAGTGTQPFRKASRDGNVTIIQNHPTHATFDVETFCVSW